MAITTIDDKHLTNIANAIRQKSGVEDTFKPSEMASAIKNISGANPILQEVVVQPSINEQTITPGADYDGLSQVKIGAVTSSIDSDIKPENIKKGVEILGVVGNIEDKPAEPVLQNKTIEPSTGKQIITADSGYDGLGQVTVNEVTSKIDSNIKADNIKQGVSILGVQGTLEQGAEVVKKYKPQWIKFEDFQGTSLYEETTNLDTSLITDMSNMFNGNNKITSINTSQFNTENVTTMSRMFMNCNKMINFNLSSFNTENVKSISNMFYNCNSLYEIDLSSFNTPNLTTVESLFQYCRSLTRIDMRNFTFGKITSYNNMLNYVPTTCLIIVKDATEKAWLNSKFKSYTNVKTLAEYQAEGGV